MRHWRGALDQIYDYNANKALPAYIPRTDTEKALIDALRQLELQCKERSDLLEALRISRHSERASRSLSDESKQLSDLHKSNGQAPGGLGQGTIAAVTYAELSRPNILQRPPFPERTSSEAAVVSFDASDVGAASSAEQMPESTPLERQAGQERPQRSLSPGKHTMRTTLRTKSGERPAKPSRKARPGEGPSKAATLAWTALGSRDRPVRTSPSDSSPRPKSPRTSTDQHERHIPSQLHWDSHSRRLVTPRRREHKASTNERSEFNLNLENATRPSQLSVSAASSALSTSIALEASVSEPNLAHLDIGEASRAASCLTTPHKELHTRRNDNYSDTIADDDITNGLEKPNFEGKSPRRKPVPGQKPTALRPSAVRASLSSGSRQQYQQDDTARASTSTSEEEGGRPRPFAERYQNKQRSFANKSGRELESLPNNSDTFETDETSAWNQKKADLLKSLPSGIDASAAKQILNDIVVEGDEVRWSDIAGLDIAKTALREAVVYPFLRPDLFMGLREPTRGMLLFGPPGTGKTMLARAVATESKSTFFSISASSLTSKFLGESEKLVRALFGLARALAPSIIFVDEIDSLLSKRSGAGEHEATSRIKTEFLIQWSDLQKAAAGREANERDRERGDATRVLVLAATNLPWAIDEAARRRFVRRQYIPLPEPTTRETQLRTLLGQQKHDLADDQILRLVQYTDGMFSPLAASSFSRLIHPGFSGSDITALAKDAAMGPLRSLGEALLHMTMDQIRPITLADFEASLRTIRPSVGKTGLQQYEDWASEFGERGG